MMTYVVHDIEFKTTQECLISLKLRYHQGAIRFTSRACFLFCDKLYTYFIHRAGVENDLVEL